MATPSLDGARRVPQSGPAQAYHSQGQLQPQPSYGQQQMLDSRAHPIGWNQPAPGPRQFSLPAGASAGAGDPGPGLAHSDTHGIGHRQQSIARSPNHISHHFSGYAQPPLPPSLGAGPFEQQPLSGGAFATTATAPGPSRSFATPTASPRKTPLIHIASKDPIETNSPSRFQPGAIGTIGDGRRTAPSTPIGDKGKWGESSLFGSIGGDDDGKEGTGLNGLAVETGWDPLARMGPASPASLGLSNSLVRSVTPSTSDDGQPQLGQSKSRPSSFILDVLPAAARDRAGSPQPPSMASRATSTSSASSGILAQSTLPQSTSSMSELLTPSSSGFFTNSGNVLSLSDARCESPAPIESSTSSSVSLDAVVARLSTAEAGLVELRAIVRDEMSSLRSEIAALRGLVLQSSLATANNNAPQVPNNGGGHAMGPRFAAAATDSPIVTLRSPSPGHSAPSTGSNAAQSHVQSLETQIAALTTAVSLLMSANNQQQQHPHAQAQFNQQTGTPLASPGLGLGLPGFGRHGSLPPLSPSLGLGMSANGPPQAGQRSPLMRPHSNPGLPRQMSASLGGGGAYGSRQNSANFDSSSWGGADNGLSSSVGSNPPGSLASKWEALGVGKEVFNSIAKYGIGPPTKMLIKAVPCILRGQDVVSQAPSIQERIQSYVVPALQLIVNSAREESAHLKGVQVVLLTATVDQSAQAQRMINGLGAPLGIRTALCTGNDVDNIRDGLVNNPAQVLVGTPRGLLELLRPGVVNVNDVRLLAIDECDQLVARNLSDQVHQLVKLLPAPEPLPAGASSSSLSLPPGSPLPGGPPSPSLLPGAFGTPSFNSAPRFGGPTSIGRQTSIVSCTVPQDVLTFAQNLPLREPVRVLARREGGGGGLNESTTGGNASISARGIKQYFHSVHKTLRSGGATPALGVRDRKLEAMLDLVEDWPASAAATDGGTIVFCSSIETVEAACYRLSARGLEPLALVRDLGTAARAQLLDLFSARRRGLAHAHNPKRVLVVYDPLARGLAAELAQPAALVVNIDLPRVADEFQHRFACAAASAGGGALLGRQSAGCVVSVVGQAQEMELLKAVEAQFRCKIAELPLNFGILAQA